MGCSSRNLQCVTAKLGPVAVCAGWCGCTLASSTRMEKPLETHSLLLLDEIGYLGQMLYQFLCYYCDIIPSVLPGGYLALLTDNCSTYIPKILGKGPLSSTHTGDGIFWCSSDRHSHFSKESPFPS